MFAPARAAQAQLAQQAGRVRPTRLHPGALDWEPPGADVLWIPDAFVPLAGTPEWEDMSEAQRLRYNQYYALEVVEQFVWIETFLILGPLGRLARRRDLDPAAEQVLKSFIDDERRHSETMGRLLRIARPDLYEDGLSFFFVPPARVTALARVFARFPAALPRGRCWSRCWRSTRLAWRARTAATRGT